MEIVANENLESVMTDGPNFEHKYPEIIVQDDFKNKARELQLTSDSLSKPSTMFMMEIKNFSMLKVMYGLDDSNRIMESLIEMLSREFVKDSAISRSGAYYICLYFSDCNQDQAEEKANVILKQVAKFEKEKKFIHIDILLSSVVLPNDEKDLLQSIQITHSLLKNILPAQEGFYLPYSNHQNDSFDLRSKYQNAMVFKNAVLENRTLLAYQPIVNSKNGKPQYYECLLRMKNEDGSVVSSGPYIPLAEEMNFINMIDEMVIDLTYNELVNNPTLNLSFNVSGANITNENWMKKAAKYFSDPQIAKRVQVEITETAIQKNMKESSNFIKFLQNFGCRVALDDFGAGYTSFSQLKFLPVDIVKIDGMYIRDVLTNTDSKFFVEILKKMAPTHKFVLVAEFVESEEIAQFLKEVGIDYLQGNYFGAASTTKPW